ncbi:MAG TPA: HAD family hydrolase, partial [Anaerolineales bacterium]
LKCWTGCWTRLKMFTFAPKELHPSWLLAVATNAADSTEAKIRAAFDRANISPWIDRIFCIRSVGFKKPSLEFFQLIRDDLQLAPEKMLLVGDDFEVDILGRTGPACARSGSTRAQMKFGKVSCTAPSTISAASRKPPVR